MISSKKHIIDSETLGNEAQTGRQKNPPKSSGRDNAVTVTVSLNAFMAIDVFRPRSPASSTSVMDKHTAVSPEKRKHMERSCAVEGE